MRQNNTKKIALGGILAAVAVVIMCLGGYIPFATYVCPMLCCAVQFVVLRFCGRRIAWSWFAIVCILSLLMGPDKEAVMVFLALGYYPIIKSRLDNSRFSVIFKVLFFNITITFAYLIMIYLLGMQQVADENMEFGIFGLVVILLLGNVTFFLLDRLLTLMSGKLR